ncbi:MAG: HAMP domain-containing histidine kinase [Leptolyngbya sp. Prado105]|jgi:K+-sensing histidine kinase KdpD|nr:HAMP domain-containing histidine kinase [Leptolyngbya sp. Prado105]
MSWINLIWLMGGVGVGFAGGWWMKRSPASGSKDLELAYRSTLELAQFKAGFLARTSHELRSPLSGLIGSQQLVLGDLCDSPEEEREFIQQANESALKLVKLLDEVINVSKAEYGTGQLKLQSVSVSDVFDNVFSLTHLLAENRNLRFQFVRPEPDLNVFVDRKTLEQVLVSLISSAIATMQEGTLKLSARADSELVVIELEDERPIEIWREAIDLLNTAPPKDLEPPSFGFSLLMNQTLIELMNGRLELGKLDKTVTQLRCVLPRNAIQS